MIEPATSYYLNQCWPNSTIHILYINEYIPLHVIIWTDIWIYAMAQVVAWRWTGDNPLPEPMLTKFNNTYITYQWLYPITIIYHAHISYLFCICHKNVALYTYISYDCIQVYHININDSIDKRLFVHKSIVSKAYYHIILIPVKRALDLPRIQNEWDDWVSVSKM